MNLEVVQPSMPKGIRSYDADAFEENSFQLKSKPAGEIDQRKLRLAKGEEIKLRNFNDGALWDKLFAEQPLISMVPDFGITTSHELEKFFCKMVDVES